MVDTTNGAPKDAAALVKMDSGGIQLATLEDGYRFAQAVIKSGLAPQGDNAATVLIKLQAGAELGIPPMRALSTFVVVKGRLSMMGEAVLAKIRASRACEFIDVGCYVRDDGVQEGRCTFKRKDSPTSVLVRFSAEDAKQAGLGGDNWRKYPEDMLIWRAVSRAAKRYFSDVLMGFDVAEVVREYTTTATEAPTAGLAPPEEPDPLLLPEAEVVGEDENEDADAQFAKELLPEEASKDGK